MGKTKDYEYLEVDFDGQAPVIIPRGDMSDKDWEALKEKSRNYGKGVKLTSKRAETIEGDVRSQTKSNNEYLEMLEDKDKESDSARNQRLLMESREVKSGDELPTFDTTLTKEERGTQAIREQTKANHAYVDMIDGGDGESEKNARALLESQGYRVEKLPTLDTSDAPKVLPTMDVSPSKPSAKSAPGDEMIRLARQNSQGAARDFDQRALKRGESLPEVDVAPEETVEGPRPGGVKGFVQRGVQGVSGAGGGGGADSTPGGGALEMFKKGIGQVASEATNPDTIIKAAYPTAFGLAGNGIPAAANLAGRALGAATGDKPFLEAMTAPGPGPDPVAPARGPAAPQPSPAPAASVPQTQSSVSASVKSRGGGSPIPDMPDMSPEMRAAVDEQKAAVAGAAEIQREQQKQLAQAAKDHQQSQERELESYVKKREYIDGQMQNMMKAFNDANEVLKKPAATVNPERYWQSHSKALFAIGVGLLAASKRGAGAVGSVLQSVNSAIERDIAAQQQEIDAPRNAAKEARSNAFSVYGMLRQQGLDEFEAYKGSRAIAKDFYANQIEQIAANSNSDLVKANARAAIGKLQEDMVKDIDAMNQHRNAAAVAKSNAQANWVEVGMKRAQQSGRLNSTNAKALMSINEGLTVIDRMRALRGNAKIPEGARFNDIMGGLGSGAWESFKAKFPWTDEAARSGADEALKFTMGTVLSKSALQKHEQEYWVGSDGKGGRLGGLGLGNLNQRQLDELETVLRRQAESILNGNVILREDGSRTDEPALPSEQRVQ